VRFPNALFQQLAAAKRGVIMEPTDAQLELPAVLQPVFELYSPIVSPTVVATGDYELSHSETLTLNRAGVTVGQTAAGAANLVAGIWRLRGVCAHFFTGTTAGLNSAQYGIALPGALGTVAAIATFNFVNVAQVVVSWVDFTFHILTPWRVVIAASPIVLGDINNESFSYHATRIL
jgi:hypothetical protein